MIDIDEKDLQNPQLCAEYTQDMYAYLRYPFVCLILHVMMARLIFDIFVLIIILTLMSLCSISPVVASLSSQICGAPQRC